jgi:ABC-type sugar transport system ATPase subunit
VFGGWFLGNPGMNYFEQEVIEVDGTTSIASPLFPRPVVVIGQDLERRVVVGIRPEHVEIRGAPSPGAVRARILRKTIGVGGRYLLVAQVDGQIVKVKVAPDVGVAVGSQVWLECPLSWVRVFGRDGGRRDVRLVDPVP